MAGRPHAHTFAKRFPAYRRDCGVSRNPAALVVGHDRGFTFSVYNPEGVDMEALRQVVETVRYDGPELAKRPTYRPQGRLLNNCYWAISARIALLDRKPDNADF